MQFRPALLFVSMLVLSLGAAPGVSGQTVPFDSERWEFEGASHNLVNYDGQESLYLKGAEARLTDDPFLNGIIEFDIAFSGKRGFSGVRWRRVDGGNTEEFYFRPHLSGMPDANQYTPVNNGVSAWQLQFGPQFSAPLRYRLNEWMHVKLVISGKRGELYLDSDEPVLAFDLRREPEAGGLAVYASGFAPAYFANFTYEKRDDVRLLGTPEPLPEAAEGAVTEWEVSDSFSEDALGTANTLPQGAKSVRTWQSLGSDASGIANLADITTREEGENTVFARLVISAERDLTKTIRFGYSDRVRVYKDDRLVYSGNNGYVTRDYRYLGTIGLFDALHLDLQRGENELLFAVSEAFGGWGVMAAIEDRSGISLAAAE